MSKSVLFVCLGNICRSPLAEGAFRVEAEKAGLDVKIDSAGVGNWHVGQPPDSRAIAVAADNDVDIAEQRARQITRHDFNRHDHIIAMDVAVLNELNAQRKDDAKAEVSLFLHHVAGREGEDVADPYYGGEEGFPVTWNDCVTGAKAIVERLAAD